MAKDKIMFVCGECGFESAKWMGKCPACGNWNTMVEMEAVKVKPGGSAAVTQRLSDVGATAHRRTGTGMEELDRVLGGGLVPGMVVLLGGDPGIGKSTLLLQAANELQKSARVLYVTGEESPAQIKMRAERLGVEGNLLLLAETDLSVIETEARRERVEFMIVDSIQTMYSGDLPGAAGSVSQVREATGILTRFAKQTGAAVIIVGHVTKDGAIAGPRMLEHMVDTVLYFEGERHADLRLLRAVKNRYGSTNEIGVFEMCDAGMRQMQDPSRIFLSGQHASGCAVICAMEGTRPVLAEVQALAMHTAFGSPKRTAAGIDAGRLSLLLAVLEKKARLRLADEDVYLNVVGGLRITERAADLGVALCVASCVKDTALSPSTAAIGEIGLTGEVRSVSRMEKRISECVRLGFTNIIVPRTDGLPEITGAKLIPVRNIAEAVALL
ncbi:MAG: DNA repair protein RadA [Eubacteriales bacterium]|nr:DNA repair protein RadA [Eubacteriales bacterium]